MKLGKRGGKKKRLHPWNLSGPAVKRGKKGKNQQYHHKKRGKKERRRINLYISFAIFLGWEGEGMVKKIGEQLGEREKGEDQEYLLYFLREGKKR